MGFDLDFSFDFVLVQVVIECGCRSRWVVVGESSGFLVVVVVRS